MSRRFIIFFVTLFVLGIASGCKKMEDRTVATVGDLEITLGELEKQYSPRGLYTDEERRAAKERILNTLIDEKLQLNEARARGYGEREEVIDLVEAKKRTRIINQLYKLEIADKAKVSSREVRKAYDMSSEELNLKHILLTTKDEAKSIYNSLEEGADFDTLAKVKSMDASTKAKGGSLGWGTLGRIRLPDEVFYAAHKLEPGEISAPIEGDNGWHIVKLIERRKVEQRPFEEMKKRIESGLTQKKMRARAESYIEGIKKLADMQYDENVVKSVAEKVPQERLSPWAQASLPNVSDEEKKKVLVTTRYEKWTVGKILERGEKSPPRSSVDTPEALKQWVEMLLVEEMLVHQALEKGLDRAKEVRAEIERERDRRMVSLLHSEVIESKSEPTDEEVKAEYEANKEKYAIPERNQVSAIVTATEDQAKNILLRLQKGEGFKRLAEKKSIHPSKRNGGKLGVVNERKYPNIFKAAKELKVGQLSQPIETKDGWAIIQVTDREPMEMRDFEDVQRLVQRDLKRANIKKNDEVFIAELKEKYPVTIDERLLEEVGKKKEKEYMEQEAEKKKAF